MVRHILLIRVMSQQRRLAAMCQLKQSVAILKFTQPCHLGRCLAKLTFNITMRSRHW